jgi:ADP-ribose pyrophosphatase YjhB (NUDIX family)
VSGAAEPGSSVVDTAVRELGEEVNVEVGEAQHCHCIGKNNRDIPFGI